MTDVVEKRAAFKVGFLRGLAAHGISPDQFFKRAFDLTDLGKGAIESGLGAAGTGLKTVGAAALLAPIAAGAATGVGAGLLNAPSNSDIETLRKSELIGLYTRLAKEIHARKQRGA